MKWLKRGLWIVLGVTVSFFVGSNIWVVTSTASRVFTSSTELPDHRIALVLGTSHRTADGKPNPFFEKRMDTSAELYRQGKIDHFLVSGDNRSVYYNEPNEMRKALLSRGVPAEAITLDYAGLRTLDSIVRSKKVFGQNRLIIITQPFHSYRALFISDFYNIDAVAIVADEPGFEYSTKVRIREYFARSKAVLDLYLLNTGPRHLGKKEEINV
jgi:SanA protein